MPCRGPHLHPLAADRLPRPKTGRARYLPAEQPQPSRPKPLGALPRSEPSRSSCARSSSLPAARPSAQRSARWAQAAVSRSQTWSLARARPTRKSQPPPPVAQGARPGGLRCLWRASALRRASSSTATRTASRRCSSSRRRSVRHSPRRPHCMPRTMHAVSALRTRRMLPHARRALRTTHACRHAPRMLHMHCCCPAHEDYFD